MFKIFSQHLKHLRRKSSESRQNQKTGEKHFFMLKQDHLQWFIGVSHMMWITVHGFQSFSLFWVFSSFWVSFALWYCMEMRHFNGKWKPYEHTAVMRWVWGRSLVWWGRGLSGATLDIISLSGMTCSKTLSDVGGHQSVLGTVLLSVILGEHPAGAVKPQGETLLKRL